MNILSIEKETVAAITKAGALEAVIEESCSHPVFDSTSPNSIRRNMEYIMNQQQKNVQGSQFEQSCFETTQQHAE